LSAQASGEEPARYPHALEHAHWQVTLVFSIVIVLVAVMVVMSDGVIWCYWRARALEHARWQVMLVAVMAMGEMVLSAAKAIGFETC
jgi:hypothetical protein